MAINLHRHSAKLKAKCLASDSTTWAVVINPDQVGQKHKCGTDTCNGTKQHHERQGAPR